MGSIFKLLVDAAGDAFALSKVVLGTVINGTINGMAVFGFRDSSGNATMPQLNSEGAIPVTFDAGTTLVIPAKRETKANMESAGLGVRVLLGTILLAPSRTYTSPNLNGTGLREIRFELVMVQDVGGSPIETLILQAVSGAGQYTVEAGLANDQFATDANVDTKELRLYATIIEASGKSGGDVYGKASCNLVAV